MKYLGAAIWQLPQAVEKRRSNGSGDGRYHVKAIKVREKQQEIGGMVISPFSFGELFKIHGSKFKPYPVGNLGEATVGCITHRVFFFGIGKDTLNRLFALLVKVGILRRIPCVVGKLLVILSYVSLYDLYTILGMCA